MSNFFIIPHLRWQIENDLTGASPTMKNISKPTLMALQFSLPPLKVQEKIIDKLSSKRKEINSFQEVARITLKRATTVVEKMILGTHTVKNI
jgi:type I restriction enzyme, S subunit